MKLLLLCKRRPQNRDLLTRPFGRFFHLPAGLARLGHEVTMLLASYEREPDEERTHAGVALRSISVRGTGAPRYLRAARRLAVAGRADWVGGLSDTWYALGAASVARSAGAGLWVDAYDNYASYMPRAWPLHRAWHRVARRADLLTVAGPTLAGLLGAGRPDDLSTLMLPMAADPVGFAPGDRAAARAGLGLPADIPLVLYGGGVHPSRDMETLFAAVALARRQYPELRLVLSGRRHPRVRVPDHALWLGYLADADMPALYQAADAVAVVNTPGAFGDYSYPIKLYEAMACQRPVVVSRTESTAWILRDHPRCLVPPGAPGAFAERLLQALGEGAAHYAATPDWPTSAGQLASALTARR